MSSSSPQACDHPRSLGIQSWHQCWDIEVPPTLRGRNASATLNEFMMSCLKLMYRNYRLYPTIFTYLHLSSNREHRNSRCSPAYCRGRFILGDAIATTKIPVAGGCNPMQSLHVRFQFEKPRCEARDIHFVCHWNDLQFLPWLWQFIRFFSTCEDWRYQRMTAGSGTKVLLSCLSVASQVQHGLPEQMSQKKWRWLPQLCDLLAYPKSFMDISMTK